MDPREGFRGVARTIGTDVEVALEEVGEVLPLSELQKCAFIVPPAQRTALAHDLIVLDQQTGRFSTSRQIASFFLDRFLYCRFDFNASDLTYRILQETIDWSNARNDWNAGQKRQLVERVRQAITNEQVSVVGIAEEAISADGDRDAYYDHLRTRNIRQFTFNPDPQVRDRVRAIVTYEGDDGIQVRVPSTVLDEGRILTQSQDPDDGSWTITIRTNTWRPV